MPENKGFYQKYNVERVDGRPIATDEDGVPQTFTIEFTRDPFSQPALKAYRDAAAAEEGYDELVSALDEILARMPD